MGGGIMEIWEGIFRGGTTGGKEERGMQGGDEGTRGRGDEGGKGRAVGGGGAGAWLVDIWKDIAGGIFTRQICKRFYY